MLPPWLSLRAVTTTDKYGCGSFLEMSCVLFSDQAEFTRLVLSRGRGRQAQMPSEPVLQPTKCLPGKPSKIPDDMIAVLHVILNSIREDVVHTQIRNLEPVPFHQPAGLLREYT